MQTCELDRTSELCQMHKCVTQVKGRKSTSASPTDTWLCTLAPGTTYAGKKYDTMFMKIGINPQGINVKSRRIERMFLKEAALGLLYELRVYNQVVSPLIDANICPNFVRSLLVSYNCTYGDLVKTLEKGLPAPRGTAQNRLNRSIHYMINREEGRPAISSRDVKQYPKPSAGHRFMVLTTEHDDVVNYWDWLHTKPSEEDRNKVALQLFIALYVMQYCRLMHNDLHAANIFIQTLPTVQRVQYLIEDTRIAFDTKLKLMIFDFDRATCPWLGENLFVTAPLSAALGESPEYRELQAFEPKRDLAGLCKSFPNAASLRLTRLRQFVDLNLDPAVPWHNARGDEVDTSIFDAISNASKSVQMHEWDVREAVFKINEFMFNKDGSLNQSHEALAGLVQSDWHREQAEDMLAIYAREFFACDTRVKELEHELETAELRAEGFSRQSDALEGVVRRLESKKRDYCMPRRGERFEPQKAAYCGTWRDLSPVRG